MQNNDKYLISKRPNGSHLEGYWEFPGGKQEKEEDLQACLEREIKEELGLIIQADYVLFTVEHEYETKKVSLHVMDCTIIAGEPRAIECQEFKWVYPADFHRYIFPPPDIKIIDFLSHRNSK